MKHKILLTQSVALLCASIFVPEFAYAYIGPGAGFAFLGSTFVFLLTILMLIATISFWPIQWAWRKIRGFGVSKNSRTKRIIILGLDGLEPSLVEKFMAEGKMPNLKKLSENGTYSRLGTTLPALSPVAWSTFQTGVNPGGHNIFDFLTRDKRHCMPQLSSTITEPPSRVIKIGKFSLALGKAQVKIMRRSQPFWKILGKHGVFSNIIRVPISYPPEKFHGNILSAMCTPDLQGTQGTFAYFTTNSADKSASGDGTTGGQFVNFKKDSNGRLEGFLVGPPNPNDKNGSPLKIPFFVIPNAAENEALLEVDGQKQNLKLNEFSPWLTVNFPIGFRKSVSGILRFCLRESGETCSVYVSPININPEKPALPIAHPLFFSSWIAKKQGLYGTLGLMEDTWGRNELALDDQRFLDQTYNTHHEREKMFMEALDKTKQGVCACVFDASDRIQHMFWRYLDDKHPSPREDEKFLKVIPEMYQKMDELVGKVSAKVNEGDVFMVLSDHGFSSFRRCVAINTWLYQNGYLALKDNKTVGRDYFQDVDWSKTKAFALGLSGLYINRKGRERLGIVEDKDFDRIKAEICAGLEKIRDTDGTKAIRKVYESTKVYRGLYASEAPDLIVGYSPGYRVSWDSVTGTIEPELFSDNVKAWSGDHHVDPKAVPGIFFTNQKLKQASPHLVDIAPTVLDLFAVPVPSYMEGRVLF